MSRKRNLRRFVLLFVLLSGILLLTAFSVRAESETNAGFVKTDDGWCYIDAYGERVTGQCIIDGTYYYFDESGLAKKNWFYMSDEWWNYYEDGKMLFSRSSSDVPPGWRYTNEKGKVYLSMKGLSSIKIPSKVDSLPDGCFKGITRDFIIYCEPGSYAEKYALSVGLPYDNGKKHVIGTSITDADEKAQWIIKNYIRSGMTDRQKALVLHNWLIYNGHYDFTYSNYAADGVLVKGAGVCQSYAEAYKLLLDKAGIESKVLSGKGHGEGHAWNLVKIDGQWYHVDCTWDDPNDSGEASVSGWERTYYFLVNDAHIRATDHTFDESISADSNCVGWVKMGNETYYYGSDGKRATGWLSLEELDYQYNQTTSSWEQVTVPFNYYFNDEGVMQTGLQTISGKTYYLDDNGRMVTGWKYFSAESGYRYFNDKGEMQTGWYTEEDKTYYFQADGFAANGLQTIEGKTYYFSADNYGAMQTGWIYFNDEGGYRYFNDKGEMQTGWYTEGDITYYFQADGLGVSGLQEVDGILCLFYNAELQKNTWWTSGDNRYYFDADGKAATGFTVIDGIKYYFNEQHIQQTGWIQLNETEIGYADLYLGLIVGNDEIIDGAIYRFDENGNLVGRVVYGGYYSPEQILEVKAERDENGKLQVTTTGKVLGIPLGWTGWVCQGNTWYYGDENGYALIGLHNIDGIPYCFNEQGELATGWIKANDKWYYADHSGIAAHNGWQQINGIWYYFYADGEMATGWRNDGGTYYYMKSDGSMLTGWVKDKGKWYYLDDNGALKTGWLNDSGNWYYLLSDGQLATGWICEGGVYYYMDKNGLMLTGWIEAGGKWYYMNESGVMQTGWLKSGNSWYYLRSGGELASGWEQIGGQWYYFKKSGAMASNEWIEDKEAEAELPAAQKRALWYWFDGSGKMAAGWKEINGQWEMFSDSGEWLYTWNGN